MSEMKLTLPEAETQLGQNRPDLIQTALERPPQESQWHELDQLLRQNPELALDKWKHIKAEARADVASGAYLVHEGVLNTPYDRAVFLAVRQGFVEQWQPRNAGEQLLVDQLALLFFEFLYWHRTLQTRANFAIDLTEKQVRRSKKWTPVRIDESEAITRTGEMVDRFNRLFLRSLRALHDLRRYATAVTIQNAGQVNIGAHQVNAAQIETSQKEPKEF